MMAVVCAVDFHPAIGHERVGDAAQFYALQRLASEESMLESEYSRAVETALDEDHLNLYRDSNRLTGTWSQIEFLRALLELSIAASAPADENRFRSMLRDQAAFVLAELEQAQRDLEREAVGMIDSGRSRVNAAVRAFLSRTATVVAGLQAEEQARPILSIVPDER